MNPRTDGRRHQDDKRAQMDGNETQDPGTAKALTTNPCTARSPSLPPKAGRTTSREESRQQEGMDSENTLNPGERQRKGLEGYKESPRLCGRPGRQRPREKDRGPQRGGLQKQTDSGRICNVISLVESCTEKLAT